MFVRFMVHTSCIALPGATSPASPVARPGRAPVTGRTGLRTGPPDANRLVVDDPFVFRRATRRHDNPVRRRTGTVPARPDLRTRRARIAREE